MADMAGGAGLRLVQAITNNMAGARSPRTGAHPMVITIAVRGEYIQLDQLLKAAGLVGSGGEAHAAVAAGLVAVDGRPEARKRAKLRPGQRVSFSNETVELVADVPR